MSIACSACATDNPAGAQFCNSCGARLEGAPPRRETRRTVTVVFVDVAGSTALGERLDPESLRRLIGEFFDLARGIVERHGGVVEKFIGDAVMAVFGLPTLHEDDALRAVRAATELQERLAASPLAAQLTIRTGINTGEVVAGDASASQRLVTGDAVNTAARLEQAAQPGEILLGIETHRLVRDAVLVEEASPIDAKGKAEPVRAFRLRSVDPAGQATTRHLDAPLVGREREMTRLLRSYEDAVAERRCGLFTLLGPAGVGKSRLVYELTTRVDSEATVLRGRCLPYGEGITYWPVAEMVRSAAGIDDADDATAAIAKLRALVGEAPDAAETVDRIGTAVGIAPGETDREDVFRAVRRLFESLAADRPLVAVFDDLQWAEPTLIDLVEHVVDWSRGSAILVVVLARPELLDTRPDWGGGKLDAQTVLLEGLTEADTRDLARSLLGGADVDPSLLDRIEAVAEGNPLFVEQLVAMLVEDGHLVHDAGGWRPATDLRVVQVPPTISALLAARLDRLPAAERHLAERASVVGRVFERIAVAELSPEPERAEVRARLQSLVRRELIRPDRSSTTPDDTFRFRHILIRDAAYEALPKRDRAEIHARFADWLEATTGGRLAEYEEIVGYHLDQAVRYREELGIDDAETGDLRNRAFRRLAEAGRRATDRSDPVAAVRLLARAADLAVGGDLDRTDVLLELGTAYLDTSLYREAGARLAEARAAADAAGDVPRMARAELLWTVTRAMADPSVTAKETDALVDRHLPMLEEAGYEAGLIDAWMVRGIAALTRSSWADATVAYERALVYAERSGAIGTAELLQTWLANALNWGPTPADVGLERAGELLGRTRSRRARALITARIAVLTAYLGRIEDARSIYREARATMEELGLEIGMNSNLGSAAIEFVAGDYAAAADLLAAGRDALASMGETGVRSTVEAFLSVCLVRLGRDADAIEASERSEEHAAADDMASQMMWRAGRAVAWAHLGRVDEALELSADAVALAETTDQSEATADVLLGRAEVLRIAGRPVDARAALDRAIELFEAKRHLPGAARARAIRAELR